MTRRVRTYACCVALALMALAAPIQTYAASKWEVVKSERADAKAVVREAEIEIKSANGVIIVNTNHSVQIKIFTILGRLVSNETIPAGKMQLQLPAHGVYIVKVGDLTCKVAV